VADLLQLEVVTPERLLVREEVSQVMVPGANGYMGILPDHAPLLSELGVGEVAYMAQGHKRFMTVVGGFVQVAGNRVRVLASTAEKADEIDVKRAEEALRRATGRLEQLPAALDVARALNAMKRARVRLQCVEHSHAVK